MFLGTDRRRVNATGYDELRKSKQAGIIQPNKEGGQYLPVCGNEDFNI